MSTVIRSENAVAYKPPPEPVLATVSSPGVSWPAALAGAAAAAALALALLVLGVGLGLSAVSPWAEHGISAGTLGMSTIAWLALTQIAASGVGGYLAGRLRSHWHRLQTDEVYFRDTAQGLLSWSIATLATAALMGSAISNVAGTALRQGNDAASSIGATSTDAITPASGPATGIAADSPSDPLGYWIDALFRIDPGATTAPAAVPAAPPATRDEARRIVLHGLAQTRLSPADTAHLGLLVTQHTGMTQEAAQARVSDAFATLQKSIDDAAIDVREKADQARQAAAYTSLWMFVALLAGAFVAAMAATYGGRRRDETVVKA